MKIINPMAILFLLMCTTYAYSDSEKVLFRWTGHPSANGFIIQIKNSAELAVLDVSSSVNEIKHDLSAGSYSIKIASGSNQKVNYYETDWIRFKIAHNKTLPQPCNLNIKRITSPAHDRVVARLSWDVPAEGEGIIILDRVLAREKRGLVKSPYFCQLEVKPLSDDKTVVREYQVSTITNSKVIPLGTTPGHSFTIGGLDPNTGYNFIVRSMNASGLFSAKNEITWKAKSNSYYMALQAGQVTPMGAFSSKLRPGGGPMASLMMKDVFFEGVSVGLSSAYWYYTGNNVDIENSTMIPVYITAGYYFSLSDRFFIAPAVSWGFSTNTIVYSDESLLSYSSQRNVQQMMMMGGEFIINITQRMFLQGGVEFGSIVETSSNLYFTMMHFGAGYSL